MIFGSVIYGALKDVGFPKMDAFLYASSVWIFELALISVLVIEVLN